MKYQKRALFRKNLTLQKRQVGTNICQILTPIIGLFVVHALRQLGESSIDMFTDRSLYIPIPYIFNIPYKPFQALSNHFNISDCLQWYLYDFASNATTQTRDFFGTNPGTPMQKPQSHGLIQDVLTYPCREHNRSVPYFDPLNAGEYESANEYLTEVIMMLHDQVVDYSNRNYPVLGLEKLPDGVVKV